ncbi:MAG: hypothetical protein ACXV3F_00300 [Frankiaceae bacterium]
MAEKKSPAQVRAEQELAEYSTYRAIQPIIPPGHDVVAFRPGHAVPVSQVEEHGYLEQGLVEKLTGEAKEQAQAAALPKPE